MDGNAVPEQKVKQKMARLKGISWSFPLGARSGDLPSRANKALGVIIQMPANYRILLLNFLVYALTEVSLPYLDISLLTCFSIENIWSDKIETLTMQFSLRQNDMPLSEGKSWLEMTCYLICLIN